MSEMMACVPYHEALLIDRVACQESEKHDLVSDAHRPTESFQATVFWFPEHCGPHTIECGGALSII